LNGLRKGHLLSNRHGRATIQKDEGGGMKDEVKALKASFHPSSLRLHPFQAVGLAASCVLDREGSALDKTVAT
jgi:hypothetical protein